MTSCLCLLKKIKLDIKKGLYAPSVSLLEAQIGKLGPSCVA